jgi:TM2 domain-containing membrane protein YozV
MLNQSKDRRVAAALAFVGVVSPIPLAGLHKFYLGQTWWGVGYLLMAEPGVSRIASAIEGIWYLFQDKATFDRNFNGIELPTAPAASDVVNPEHISSIAQALRHLDQLRQDGLISEYEFEQKRRSLLDKID